MYQAGDLIMYGATGVCRVDAITAGVFDPEDERQYYVLAPLYQTGTIYAPVDNNKVFIRPILTEEEANQLIDRMPEIHSEVYKSNSIQQLSKHYQDVIDTHECVDLVEMTKSIYRKKQEAVRQNRHLGQIDRKFMKRAEDLLYGEIAAALEIAKEDVEAYIANRLGKDWES